MHSIPVVVLCLASLVAKCSAGTSIIGGHCASAGDIPWIASLASGGGGHFCGASILDAHNILTAAHCVDDIKDVKSSGLKVRIGSLTIDKGGKQYKVKGIRIHPGYKDVGSGNDIAILHVDEAMQTSGAINGVPVSPVQLPTGSKLAKGTSVRVAGWGAINKKGDKMSDCLKTVDLPVVRCDGGGGGTVICAGEPGHDSCAGDSGGPLTKGGVQYGIVSFGPLPCADPTTTGSYSDVAHFLPWIRANMSKNGPSSNPADPDSNPSDPGTNPSDPDYPANPGTNPADPDYPADPGTNPSDLDYPANPPVDY